MTYLVKLLERYSVGPPPGSIEAAPPLPLTLFDIFWYPIKPVKAVFFYTLLLSADEFFKSQFPVLKQSLSLALQRFYPLAGRLEHTPEERFPCLCYTEGNTVEFTVAESSDDFVALTADTPKAASRLQGLAPSHLQAEIGEPVIAFQATLFPNQGIAIGITVHHVGIDLVSMTSFMRTWGAICRGEAGHTVIPCFDRNVVKECTDDIAGPLLARMNRYLDSKVMDTLDKTAHGGLLRATFRLSGPQIEDLRSRVSAATSRRCSTFALTTALLWISRLKAQGGLSDGDRVEGRGDSVEWLVFATDMRSRFHPPIPTAYFGNLLGSCRVSLKRADLVGPGGLAAAAEAVQEAVEELRGPGGVRRATEVLGRGMMLLNAAKGRGRPPFTVAGYTRTETYGTDFGWGRPVKMETTSIETTGAMSMNERDGVVEIGVVLLAGEMDAFAAIIKSCLASKQNDRRSRI